MKIFFASGLAILLFITAAPFAQGKNAPAEPIPYHSAIAGNSANLDVGGIAVQPVPPGKRLIVEYVSLFLQTSSATTPYTTDCQVEGFGPSPDFTVRAHYIKLQDRSNGLNGTVFTGSEPVKLYLEPGVTPRMSCSSGLTGFSLSLRGWVSGQLVDAP